MHTASLPRSCGGQQETLKGWMNRKIRALKELVCNHMLATSCPLERPATMRKGPALQVRAGRPLSGAPRHQVSTGPRRGKSWGTLPCGRYAGPRHGQGSRKGQRGAGRLERRPSEALCSWLMTPGGQTWELGTSWRPVPRPEGGMWDQRGQETLRVPQNPRSPWRVPSAFRRLYGETQRSPGACMQ